jgi:hypothetical protein
LEAPVTSPTVTEIGSLTVGINWDEPNLQWLGITVDTGGDPEAEPISTTNYIWDATNTQWNEV